MIFRYGEGCTCRYIICCCYLEREEKLKKMLMLNRFVFVEAWLKERIDSEIDGYIVFGMTICFQKELAAPLVDANVFLMATMTS